MAGKQKKIETENPTSVDQSQFKITRSKIQQMYKDDKTIVTNVNRTLSSNNNLQSLTAASLKSNYYNAKTTLENQRNYSSQAYSYYPIYSTVIDYLSNMYYWRYTYTPRLVKNKNTNYAEMYSLMTEVVDGLVIETIYPTILTDLFITGAVYLIAVKNTSSKSITVLQMPYKYCRPTSVTQFGTVVYQFDFSYFDSLGLSKSELEEIFNYYPKEMKTQYEQYRADPRNSQWQKLDPKYAGAILLNESGFPNKLYSLFAILQYQEYLDNELQRNGQLLDKIISHKLPTWQDKLVVEIDEMVELHQSMAKIVAKNDHVRLLTTFGDMDVHSIGEDVSKENKTLENAYNSIYNNNGLNHSLFNSDTKEAQLYSLIRDESYVWKYIQQLTSFFNLVINNCFNFGAYQCDLTILPITHYNQEQMLLNYKEGATLGVSKLEYIIASGIKQVNIGSKIELENYLQLDKLKPLSTAYTQKDNNKSGDDSNDKEPTTKDNSDTSPIETDNNDNEVDNNDDNDKDTE